jgi:hypothetical protein
VRRLCVGICLAAALAACGGGPLTLSEYASEAESLVAGMEGDFARLDNEWESESPSIDRADEYWEGRLAVRYEFLESVRALDPPEAIAEQHAAALDVFGRMTAADEALATRVAGFDVITEHWQWVDTPEGQAAEAILEEVFAFCRASQADYDATKDRAPLQDVPWIPSAMSEVVSVAFGCPP